MNCSFKYLRLLVAIVLPVSVLVFSGCKNTESQNDDDSNLPINTTSVLTEDGAWCWFSDPRAIYYDENLVITGWVKKDGSVEVASLDLNSGEKKFNTIYPQLEIDDHDNPAFAVLPNGNVFTMFAWHSTKKGVISNQTSNGSDVQSFGENVIYLPKTEELLGKFPRETYTYANPYVLKEEDNKLFVFGRWIGFKPNMIISTDNGKTWDEQYVIISSEPFDPNNRPYVKYYSDGKSKIHLVFTDGHPEVEPQNSVYYCYYKNGSFWRADGSQICNLEQLPFSPEEASLVYKPSEKSGRAWIADIVEKNDVPYILYSRHPEKTDHRYHYAWFNSKTKTWEDYEICKAGKWFPQTQPGKTERESYYMGNLTLHPENPNAVYLSREVNGVFEIEKHKTENGGSTWAVTPITRNSAYDNVRPYVPRYLPENTKTVVLWMENKKYIHYTDYDTSIKYFVDNE